MRYRIGCPFWKVLYKLGISMTYRYEIFYDASCKRFFAICDDINGLIAEGDNIQEVQDVIEGCAPDFVDFYVYGKGHKRQNSRPAIYPQMLLGRGLVSG